MQICMKCRYERSSTGSIATNLERFVLECDTCDSITEQNINGKSTAYACINLKKINVMENAMIIRQSSTLFVRYTTNLLQILYRIQIHTI